MWEQRAHQLRMWDKNGDMELDEMTFLLRNDSFFITIGE